MNQVGQREIITQRRVVEFLHDTLGFRYLGNWQDRDGNSNIEEELLARWLSGRGEDDSIITRTLHQLRGAAALGGTRKLYDANQEMSRAGQ